MKFLSDDILLTSPLAKELYCSYAKDLPIIDYHCHINPYDILQDKKFGNITRLWLYGDHYKWRLMRNCAVEEKYITGDADDYQKFEAFANCLPRCIGNPIYIWCHMELKKYFGYDGEINSDSARRIFDLTAQMLESGDYSAVSLIKKSNVEIICTTDDPIDNLKAHSDMSNMELPFIVLPSFRPDNAVNIEKNGFTDYIKRLGKTCGINIENIDDLKDALLCRLKFFIDCGCRVSDHAVDYFLYAPCDDIEAKQIFEKRLKGQNLTDIEIEKFKTHILLFLAENYNKAGIVTQLHFNCLRNNNTLMFEKLGADTGFDSINRSQSPDKLVKFIDALSKNNALPKTVIYSLDPNDDKLINTIINCFQGDAAGKIQHGSAWWFNDTKNGILSQLNTLAEYSVLGNFIGMLTDSRSFTSYIRHDYFRRLLCDFIAKQVNSGEYPQNKNSLKTLIENICYYNVKNYIL